uniref:Uncharacterized protein n=1 Tax=viral metagenome TaxID=1070528 RepID=A0A6M3K0T6_9ZZZZ
MDEATKLLIELRQTVRCTHLDMGGKNKYMLTIQSQPIMRKINEYLSRATQLAVEGGADDRLRCACKPVGWFDFKGFCINCGGVKPPAA